MAKQIIAKHYQRILTQWPTDLLRPTVSFQKAIQSRIDTRLTASAPTSTSTATSTPTSTPTPSPGKAVDGGQTLGEAKNVYNEKSELEQVNVLYSFLEDRYVKKYPLSEKMLRPLSRPNHYTDLLRELEEAPKRSWLRARFNRWRGIIRSR